MHLAAITIASVVDRFPHLPRRHGIPYLFSRLLTGVPHHQWQPRRATEINVSRLLDLRSPRSNLHVFPRSRTEPGTQMPRKAREHTGFIGLRFLPQLFAQYSLPSNEPSSPFPAGPRSRQPTSARPTPR